jgi:hypothetical protein
MKSNPSLIYYFTFAFAAALSSCPLWVSAEERKFTAKDGRALTGEFISMEGEMVTIRRSDGAIFTVRADTFILDDQQYFKTATPKPVRPPSDAGKGKAPPAAKVTASQIQTYPFSPTAGDARLDPKTRGIFDELRVNASERIRIYGKKEKDSGQIDGRVAYHLGKAAVFPSGNRSGIVATPLASSEDVRRYFALLEVGEKFVTKEIKLGEKSEHTWSLSEEGGNTVLKISLANNESVVVSAPTASVTGAGFAATVRWIGNEADLRVDFDDPKD